MVPTYLGEAQANEKRLDAAEFFVNGTSIPDVDFDVGPSFAGLLPIGPANDGSSLFFWFFPSSAEDSPREIVIWLNGGVSPPIYPSASSQF